ncbi:MAG TPA: GNAT family N-acetyltransferase [Kiloniellales bacterium]|nr:GNAT family N-acetyltransferase [Kiloniellales bacterium]
MESRLRAAATAHALPPAPSVRRAEGRDLDGLVRLEQRCFDLDRLSRRSLRHFLMRGRSALLVTERGPGELAGYALVVFRRGSRVARLYSIAVDPAERRRGLGGRLLQAAEAAAAAAGASELRLEVRADNRAAIAAYENAGYERIGRYADYYEDRADALRLAKGLGAAPGKAPARLAWRKG